MTAVAPALGACRFTGVNTLTHADLDARRRRIEKEYETREYLLRKRDFTGLTLDESIALEDFDDIDFLKGR